MIALPWYLRERKADQKVQNLQVIIFMHIGKGRDGKIKIESIFDLYPDPVYGDEKNFSLYHKKLLISQNVLSILYF